MIEVVNDEVASDSRKSRDRTAREIHYYNNNVLKARTGFKSPSVNCQQQQQQQQQQYRQQSVCGNNATHNRGLDNLYRSNSSLELPHDYYFSNECHRRGRYHRERGDNTVSPRTVLKREYGSHGSIDIITNPVTVHERSSTDKSSEQLYSMLQDYKPVVSLKRVRISLVVNFILIGIALRVMCYKSKIVCHFQ